MSDKEITDEAKEAVDRLKEQLEKEEQNGRDSLTEVVIAMVENNKGAS